MDRIFENFYREKEGELFEDISKLIKPAKTFMPKESKEKMIECYEGWKNALEHIY